MSKNKERSHELKVKILTLIGRFGWLRINEIAKIVWPEAAQKNAFKYADLHLRRLEQVGYLQLEKLPEKGGTAATLLSKAIRFLRIEGVEVTKVAFNPHQPGSEWKHDLLTSSLFALLVNDSRYCQKDAKYMTDRECKRVRKDSTNEVLETNGKIKVPDLILQTDKWGLVAIEVERSPKSGTKNKEPLTRTLILTNTQEAPYIYGDLKPQLVLVAYDINQKTTRQGKEAKVSHGKNIFNTVGKQLSLFYVEKIRVIAIKMVVEKHAVVYYGVGDTHLNQEEIKVYFDSEGFSEYDPTL
jgi:hypothetical protein